MMIPRKQAGQIAVTLLIGGVGGWLAGIFGVPMPYLIGSLLATGVFSFSGVTIGGLKAALPNSIRQIFVGIIGVLIGGTFTSGVLSTIASVWIVAIAVTVFVVIAFAVNFLIFTRIGKYDRNTAFFAAMPGGLIESIAFGEKLGANIQILTLQQFSRITLVITVLPFIFLVWTGQTVGSAAGISLNDPASTMAMTDAAILIGAGVIGFFGGRVLRLPAYILVGPLIGSAIVHVTGLTAASPPPWLISVAQVVVGAGLGARFGGVSLAAITKTLGLAVLSVSMMLLIDVALVLVLVQMQDQPFEVLLISLAPGGVTETALIALSLGFNPVFVTTLHIFRIIFTVVLCSIGFRFLDRAGSD